MQCRFLKNAVIKGTHMALNSGMLTAEATFEALTTGQEEPVSLSGVLEWKENPVEIVSWRWRNSGSRKNSMRCATVTRHLVGGV